MNLNLMSKLIIAPIIYKDSWHKDLANMMLKIIIDEIFKPILQLIDNPDRKDNAKTTALEKALRAGTIRFEGGAFKGAINAAISKEIKELGGKFFKGYWRIPSPKLPGNLQNAIYYNRKMIQLFELKFTELVSVMPKMLASRITDMSIEALGLANISKVSREFKRTVGRAYAVMPDIKDEGRAILKDVYFDNEELPIRKKLLWEFEERSKAYLENFAQEEVALLRRKVSELVADGRSRIEVKNLIQNRLNISDDRCKFIARQETSLLTSNFKEIQYRQAGIDKYIWRTVGDNRVRDKHDELDGKPFSFSNPPDASYFNTNEPCNPGEDYRCRCVALPIIEW